MTIMPPAGELPLMPRTRKAADVLVPVASVGSTNVLARELVDGGKIPLWPGEPVTIGVVAAQEQTNGHGRLGRTWVSEEGESFTVSFVATIPRALAVDESVNGWLPMIAGRCALDAIHGTTGLPVGTRRHREGDGIGGGCESELMLKWPNDIFLAGCKLGGILAELVSGRSRGAEGRETATVAIIFGIGINMRVPQSRLPIRRATSLQLHVPDLQESGPLRDAMAARIAQLLKAELTAFDAEPRSRAAMLREEVTDVCWTLGRRVEARLVDGTRVEGRALRVNPDASLTIETDDHMEHVVRTGDVGILPAR